MAIKIVQLGSKRLRGEGLRIGAVRRPPRGVFKSQYSRLNYYDVRYPDVAPSAKLLKWAKSDKIFLKWVKSYWESDWKKYWDKFTKKYKQEMAKPESSYSIDLLAAMSHYANFSIGCYCADEKKCHRSILKKLLKKRRAKFS